MTRHHTFFRFRGPRRSDARRGVSLMEVLISIGVVSIGLTGLAFLLPVAHHQAESGARNDRKGNVGKRAYREFVIREMAQPDIWRRWDGDNFLPPLANDGFFARTVTFNDSTDSFVMSTGVRRLPVCIDPRSFAVVPQDPTTLPMIQATQVDWADFGFSPTDATAYDAMRDALATFPAYTSSAPQNTVLPSPAMVRATLAPVSTIDLTDPTLTSAQLATLANLVMTTAQADAVFMFEDDLAFTTPSDISLGPVQQTLRDGTAPNDAHAIVRRRADGHFSWIATLVPVLGAELEHGIDNDLYRLSIAVLFQRNVIKRERWTTVTVTHGIGGGPVTQTGALLPIPPGEWVMLANQNFGQYRWYRVMQSDGALLSLDGEDWKPDLAGTPADCLIYLPGVVNVYEKTIRLETSSLWTR